MLTNLQKPAKGTWERERKEHRRDVLAKSCVRCGVDITHTKWARKLCSFSCAREFEREKFAAARLDASKPCLRCGVTVVPSKPCRAAGRKYCTRRCANLHRMDQRPACPICGKARSRMLQTCSAKCGYLLRKSKLRKQVKCKQCGEVFWPVRRAGGFATFCSIKCLNARKAQRHRFICAKCEHCGAEFKRSAAAIARVNKLFCGRACRAIATRGAGSSMYRGGKDPNRGGEWVRLAEAIRARDGHRCQRCNRTQQENKHKLSVDHIIPWRSFTDKVEANNPTNLISLCKRCHGIKTVLFERPWLKGDRVAMEQYKRSIQLKPLFAQVDVMASERVLGVSMPRSER